MHKPPIELCAIATNASGGIVFCRTIIHCSYCYCFLPAGLLISLVTCTFLPRCRSWLRRNSYLLTHVSFNETVTTWKKKQSKNQTASFTSTEISSTSNKQCERQSFFCFCFSFYTSYVQHAFRWSLAEYSCCCGKTTYKPLQTILHYTLQQRTAGTRETFFPILHAIYILLGITGNVKR